METTVDNGSGGMRHDIGKLEARVDGVETRLQAIERDVAQILLYVTTIKGLAHILIALGSIATTVAGVIEFYRLFK